MQGTWLLAVLLAWNAASHADTSTDDLWLPQLLGAQYTGIRQHLYPFAAAYSGPLSLTAKGDTETSDTFGVYLGMQLPEHLSAYVDVEMFKGGGVGGGTGLAGLVNGDVVRAGTGLPKTPYVARAFLQYTLPLGDAVTHQDRAMDQLPGDAPVSAFGVKLGKLSVADDFDQNRYADSVRTQFLNLAFVNDLAWDYAADTRGYTDGLVLDLAQPEWALKFGYYRMPLQANHQQLEWPVTLAHGANLEFDFTADSGTVLRLLLYRNVARMGVYADALAIGASRGTPPSISTDDMDGRVKQGYGINLEQPLADDGETGLFLRYGWDDGRTESFAYVEADQNLSGGAQLSGRHWGRGQDLVGLGLSYEGLSAQHRAYLAAGGCGFSLCDGRLDYGYERVMEAYYRAQLGKYAQLGPDFQYIAAPGYNRARGPARVAGLRLHLSY